MNRSGDKIFIEDIRAGWEGVSQFLAADVRLGQTKTGKPYVSLTLKDKTGEMEARVWDQAEAFNERFKGGGVIWVKGAADSYQNKVQMKVVAADIVPTDQIVFEYFMPCSPHDPDRMTAELGALVSGLSNEHIRGLLLDILNDPEIGRDFRTAPAAKRFHHAYRSGLLEHTLSVCRSCVAICRLYPNLNQSLLIAGAVLHDIGKIREFDLGLNGDYTDEGRLVGHLLIGLEILDGKLAARPDFPPDLALLIKHLILSHHGEYDLGSPKRPKILEGLVLHLLDDLDAKMNGIGGFIKRHADPASGWTDFNRLMDRYFFDPKLPPEAQMPEESPPPEVEPPTVESMADEPVEAPAPSTGPARAATVETPVNRSDREAKADPSQLSLLGD